MKRLNKENINCPKLSNDIFNDRWGKELQYIDWNRFELLAKKYNGGKLIDIGVFNSPLIIELKKAFNGSEFVGLDYSEPIVVELQRRHPEVRYITGDARGIPFEDGHFDYVVMGELIEHLEDPAKAIKEAMRVLREGGTLALSTPKDEETQGLISKEHLWSFKEEDIKDLLKPYGEPEISTYKDTVECFVAYCQKRCE